jgi:hypothetical protein
MAQLPDNYRNYAKTWHNSIHNQDGSFGGLTFQSTKAPCVNKCLIHSGAGGEGIAWSDLSEKT